MTNKQAQGYLGEVIWIRGIGGRDLTAPPVPDSSDRYQILRAPDNGPIYVKDVKTGIRLWMNAAPVEVLSVTAPPYPPTWQVDEPPFPSGGMAEELRKGAISGYLERCHRIAVEHGFWDNSIQEGSLVAPRETIGMKLMLIVTELTEWMEAVRHGDPASDHIPEFTTSEEEAADVLIRVFDLADALKMRLPQALEAKIAYNQRREHMHGKTC